MAIEPRRLPARSKARSLLDLGLCKCPPRTPRQRRLSHPRRPQYRRRTNLNPSSLQRTMVPLFWSIRSRALPRLRPFSLLNNRLFRWNIERGNVPSIRRKELADFRLFSEYSFIAYTFLGEYSQFINPDIDYVSGDKALKDWTERKQLYSSEDEQALLELFDVIEERNMARI